ncbi:MAG: 30S ribosomal protein S16 [bacterium]|nr:30S ribosomal protein S16 [bacterium]
MSTTIRLSRVGSKKEARYRIVVKTTRSRRDGQALEVLGTYAPLAPEEKQVVLNLDSYHGWIKLGALPSRTVASLAKRVS